jgi:NAD dependent epimerase/dehydratase
MKCASASVEVLASRPEDGKLFILNENDDIAAELPLGDVKQFGRDRLRSPSWLRRRATIIGYNNRCAHRLRAAFYWYVRVGTSLMNFSGKRVLVTGADGFIGSHLVELLTERGSQVRSLAQYNSFNHWGWLEDVACRCDLEVVSGDIRDPHFCMQLVKHVDVIFHLAALIPIPFSYRAPASYVDTNVTGTLNICQAALNAPVERLVHVSTSEVYGTAQYVPMDERHPLQAQSPYSATKIAADSISYSFYCSFDLPVVIARPFNCYGPRQSARAVIPTIISQLAANRDEISLGDVRTTRDFTFVTDTCRGMLALCDEKVGLGEVFHIGSNFEISIQELFCLISRMMGKTARIAEQSERKRPEKSEVRRLWCNNEKLASATGFRPAIPLDQGVAKTIDWFQRPENLKFYKTYLYNV